MKLLYNATILSNSEEEAFRTGIYFVALERLKAFLRLDDIELTLYAEPDKVKAVRRLLQKQHWSLPVVTQPPSAESRLLFALYRLMQKVGQRLKRHIPGTWRVGQAYLRSQNRVRKRDMARWRKYDCYFSPCEEAPLALDKAGIPSALIIHDLIPYVMNEFPVTPNYWLYPVIHRVSARKLYFCISEQTRHDFLALCPDADPDRVFVIPNGYTSRKETAVEDAPYLRSIGVKKERYILLVGSVVKHKNIPVQLSAALDFTRKNAADFSVVIAGHCRDEEAQTLLSLTRPEDRDRLKILGYVADDCLPVLYRNAFCLSFASLYEGFGLPALEAFENRCPVVTSNTSSLPEVAGDAALYVDPKKPAELTAAYETLCRDSRLRRELTEKGLARLERFSWDKTSLEMYNRIKENLPATTHSAP